jgi:hypothetical protein
MLRIIILTSSNGLNSLKNEYTRTHGINKNECIDHTFIKVSEIKTMP